MNLISKVLPLENVILDADSTSKKRVFERVGVLFENTQKIARSQVFDSLFAREKLGSTGLGHGVAIPHGRIKGSRISQALDAAMRYSHAVSQACRAKLLARK